MFNYAASLKSKVSNFSNYIPLPLQLRGYAELTMNQIILFNKQKDTTVTAVLLHDQQGLYDWPIYGFLGKSFSRSKLSKSVFHKSLMNMLVCRNLYKRPNASFLTKYASRTLVFHTAFTAHRGQTC